MRKGSDVIGLNVVAFDTGEQFEKVIDLIFDRQANNLLALLTDESGWFSSANIIPFRDVKTIGHDAIIVSTKDVEIGASQMPEIEEILNEENKLRRVKLMTTDGRDLGQIVDLYFDEQTGKVEGYEVSGGVFADAYSGRSFVPAYQTLTIGNDVAFVPPEVADMMEEQVGGIKAAAQSATETVSSAASTAGASLSSATRSATAVVTNRVVDPAEQRTFAVGKTAQNDVETPDGLLIVAAGQTITEQAVASAEQHNLLDAVYRAAGGSVASNLRETVTSSVSSAAASRTVEQARGRRVQQSVRNADGLIIAASGQIVTEQVIERARTYNREAELMDAVGLTAGEAARSSASGVTSSATDSLRSGATQVSATASGLLDRAREKISELRDSAAQEAEERRITNALGRPVNRVILDQQDNVILNVGELITHKAVDEARASGVLEVLLSSVYDKEPELTTDDLRAPTEGDASLEHQQKANL